MPSAAGRLQLSSTNESSKRLLTRSLVAGKRSLAFAAALSTLGTGATAAGFFALAAVAQDALVGHRSWERYWGLCVLFGVAVVVRAAANYLAARLALDGSVRVESDLRDRLLRTALGSSSGAQTSAEFASTLMDQVERVGTYAERYQLARLTTVTAPLVLLAVIFPLNWVVGVVLLLCAPLPAVNLSIVGIGTATVARRHNDQLRFLSGYFLDRLRGLATLRDLGAEEAEIARVERASSRLADTAMSVLRVAFVAAGVLEAVVTVAIAVVAIYIGLTLLRYVHVPGLPSHMSLRTGLFLLMVTPLYFQPVRALAAAYHERADALASIESIADLLKGATFPRIPECRTGLHLPPRIQVRGLVVRFPDREQPALDGVSLDIPSGELLGVAGASGAGKSTFLRVLSGDLDPTTGSVTIDDYSPREIERTSIAWLGQHPYFFSGSLAENIALGRADPDDPAVLDAAVKAGLEGVVDRLPSRVNTPIGEAGFGLSGGEAQRLALARVLFRPPPLLLLDEPTAHLDAATQESVLQVIRDVAVHSTTVLVSHSAAVLSACDRVVVLDRGLLIGANAPSLLLRT
jgi:ATP-binding cassette, subfamily C, bacterial CydD